LAEPDCTIATHTASDGYVWRYRRYLPAAGTPPRAHVVAIHGIQSHGGWYEYSCTRLAQAGHVVSFLDRRGSGLNDRARGDAPSFRRLIDDIIEFLSRSSPLPHAATFLIGISWGGKLAAAVPCCRPALIDGLVLMCPGFFPRLSARQKRMAFLASVIGIVRPTQRFPIPLNDPELFTTTARWQQYLRDDSLALHKATGRFLGASLHLDRYLQYVPRRLHLPALLMLAENDRIIDNGPTCRYFQRLAAADKRIIEYAGAQHTLEFEPRPDLFIGDLIDWFRKHDGVKTV
jgi:alpha-beta hydrolase superfamily lysophospholipase